jgi:hypothetical protein
MTVEEALDHMLEQLRENLGRLAKDTQNVHTTYVSKQTTEGLQFLFEVPIPDGQNTMEEIRSAWDRMYGKDAVASKLYDDMNSWYNKDYCREPGDYLYRRVLDHAWAKIKTFDAPIRKELIHLLQRECADAYHMCCDGHITRIVNTFGGFVEFGKPPVSVGELLQEKITEISQIEDVKVRMAEAHKVFQELGISEKDAAPWIEALTD